MTSYSRPRNHTASSGRCYRVEGKDQRRDYERKDEEGSGYGTGEVNVICCVHEGCLSKCGEPETITTRESNLQCGVGRTVVEETPATSRVGKNLRVYFTVTHVLRTRVILSSSLHKTNKKTTPTQHGLELPVTKRGLIQIDP